MERWGTELLDHFRETDIGKPAGDFSSIYGPRYHFF
jgi:hypothetical protein